MSDEDKPSIVSGSTSDPRSMWLTRSNVDKEAQWAVNKKKIEKPGYSYVRHTTDEYVSGVRNAADGYAWGAMQLNLTDLRSAMGNTDAGFDDTEIQKELAAQAAKIEKNIQDISLLKTGKADKDHTHSDSGSDYDDSWIQPKLDKKSDLTHTHSSYSDLNHTHDTTHNHDKEYQAKGDYAAEIHGHIEYETKVDATIAHDTLNQSISDKADSRHKHDGTYAEFVHSHPLEPHGHDDKYQKLGSYAEEIHFHDEYAENTELNVLDAKLDDEIKDREEQGNSLQGQIDALEPYDDTEIKEQALKGILAVDYDMRYQDSQYQIRLDYRLFGEPTLSGKVTAFHDDDSWPVVVDDDLLHFQSRVPSDRPQVMFKGEKLPAKTKYAFFHFNGERQEWKVSKVEYANGVNRVYGYAVTGTLIVSESAKCDAWFLTEEEALSAPDVTDDLLDLSGETTAFTGVENFQSKGTLAYKNAAFTLGADVVVKVGQFVANPAAVGLNHDIVPSGRIMWVDEFPVGSTMIIKGAAATLALEVVQSRKSGNNNRAHGFDVNVLLESGAFVDGESLQIGTGDLIGGRRLLLDDMVVGDSAWEDRIATLESIDHDDYATSIDLLETQVQLEAVAPTVESGYWTVVYNQPAPGPGEVQVDTFSGTSPNSIYINETDLDGNAHGFADVKIGDFVETVINAERWTLHQIFNIRSGDEGVRIYDMQPQKNQGNLQSGNDAFLRFIKGASNDELTDQVDALEDRVAYLESVLQPFLPFSLGVYGTKKDNYEPTGSSQAEGTAAMWWIDAVNNTTPENHARLGMVDKDLCSQVANMPVPFELDVIQGDLKQTWVIAESYERGAGVLHLLSSGGWGDRLGHSTGTSVDTEYVVRKV